MGVGDQDAATRARPVARRPGAGSSRGMRRPVNRRARAWAWPLVIGLVCTLTWSSPAGADPAAGFGEAVDRILDDPLLRGGAGGGGGGGGGPRAAAGPA